MKHITKSKGIIYPWAAGAAAPGKCLSALQGITRSVTKLSFMTPFVTKQAGQLKAGLDAELRGEAASSPPPKMNPEQKLCAWQSPLSSPYKSPSLGR